MLGIEYAKDDGVYEVEAERRWCETEKPIRITRDWREYQERERGGRCEAEVRCVVDS
jgi:hypothetical protein